MRKKKILILSHTSKYSHFKIGSHHYANGLNRLYDVTYIGIPYTLAHKMFKRNKEEGISMLNDDVKHRDLKFIFPITTTYIKLNIIINKIANGISSLLSSKPYERYYDIVICDYPFYSPYLNAIDYGKLIYRPTDVYVYMSGEKVKMYEYEIIKKSDSIISTSQKVSDFIKETYPSICEKIHIDVISNGYDHHLFNMQGLSEERSSSVYIGAIDYRFDFDMLSLLAKENRSDLFDIYGPISDDFRDIVDELIQNNKNIRFFGSVDYNNVPSILKKYKVGLLLLNDNPSNLGRSPMKIWEYAACGLNILYAKIDVGEKYGFLYPYCKGDILNQYRAAITLTTNLEDFQEIKKYSWENNIIKISNIIERLIDE